jgi:hypothetical protein
MKTLPWIALVVLAVVAAPMSGCKPAGGFAGQYKSDSDKMYFETLDLAEGGAATHRMIFLEGIDPHAYVGDTTNVIYMPDHFEMEQAKWSVDGNTIKVEGQSKEGRKVGRTEVHIFQIQENGDLVRDMGDSNQGDRFSRSRGN